MPLTKYFGNDAPKQKQLQDARIAGGQLGDSIQAGIQNIRPVDEFNQPLSSGSFYQLGDQAIRTLDGTIRIIDGSVFDNDIKKVKEQERKIMEMIELFVSAGNDKLVFKYLGRWSNYLKKNQSIGDVAVKMGMLEGDVASLTTVNALPSYLRFLDKTSENFVLGINKMRIVIEASGIAITNRSYDRPVEVREKSATKGDDDVAVIGDAGANTFSPEKLFLGK